MLECSHINEQRFERENFYLLLSFHVLLNWLELKTYIFNFFDLYNKILQEFFVMLPRMFPIKRGNNLQGYGTNRNFLAW